MVGFTYKSYNFVDKDPIIDSMRRVVADSGFSYTTIEQLSGVTKQTLRNWFDGTTKRPQAATVNAVLRALGYKLAVTYINVPDNVIPLPPPEQYNIRHIIHAKRRTR